MLIAPKEVMWLSFSAKSQRSQMRSEWNSCSVVSDWIGICLSLSLKLKADKMQAYVNKKGTLIKTEGNIVRLKNIGDSSTDTVNHWVVKYVEKRRQVNSNMAHMADG